VLIEDEEEVRSEDEDEETKVPAARPPKARRSASHGQEAGRRGAVRWRCGMGGGR